MSKIKELQTVLIAALAMAWGIAAGYKMALDNRLQIPDGMSVQSIQAGVFLGGFIAALVVCFVMKLLFEASWMMGKRLVEASRTYLKQRGWL